MTRSDYDVLVVGAGPAGLSTAITAARNGASVLLVERHAGTTIYPRATGVSTRSMELFGTWGVADQVRAGAVKAQPLMSVGSTLADRHGAMPFGYPESARAVLAVSPTVPVCCPQDHIESVLAEHLLACGGEIRFDAEVTDVSVDTAGVTARLVDRPTGWTDSVHAGYVVGADGPRSTVRTALGIEFDELGRLGEYMNILFRADIDAVVGELRYALYAVEHEEAGGVIVPAGGGRWIYGKEWDPEAGQSPADFTPQRCMELLRAAAGVPDLDVEVLSVSPFTMVGRLARAFRAGRGFLVGDAAHQMTPVGGVGMNTALHDGHNLGWKLAWVVRGWAEPALLDSYEPERRPVAERNTRSSLRFGGPPQDALAVDLGVTYHSPVIVDGGTGGGGAADLSKARPGARAPHAWVRHGGRRCSTLELFDGRLTLLVGRRATGWRRAAARLSGGLPMTVLTLGRDLPDPSGVVAERYGVGAQGAVLVRPDGYVAWQTEHAVAPATLAAAVAAALGGRPDAVLARPA